MKTAVYLRQSLDRDGNQLAISRQREACLDLCQRRGWVEVVEYVDNDQSASKGTRREYVQMLADIESGAIGAVVCYHLDRLHRQPAELEAFIALADRRGIALATVTGEVDLSSDQGRLVARIMASVARAEVERKGMRQRLANKQRAQNGKGWVVRSFGYDGNQVVEAEAELIRQASNDLVSGNMTLYGIARAWNAAGVKTTKGNQWSGSTVRQVLSRARNAGLQVRDVHDGKGATLKARIEAAIMEGVEVSWPAIVSREVFDGVLSVLSEEGRKTGKSAAIRYLLSGIARCGCCGQAMVSTTAQTKRPGIKRNVLACKNIECLKIRRSMPVVDGYVTGLVCDWLARPDAAELLAHDAVDTRALGAEVSRLRALITAAETDYAEGTIDGKALRLRKEKLTPKIDALTAQLVGAHRDRRLEGLVGNVAAREIFDALPLDRQRTIIDTLVTVTIKPASKAGGRFDPADIAITWR